MNKKIKKIAFMIVIFVMALFLQNQVNAWIHYPDGAGYYATTNYNGHDIMCIHFQGPLKSNSLLGGLYEGQRKGNECSYCDSGAPSVSTRGENAAYTSEYYNSTTIDWKAHQDVAYMLTFVDKYYSGNQKEIIQRMLWQTDLNVSGIFNTTTIDLHEGVVYPDPQHLFEEAKAYRTFYERVQREGGFRTKDLTNVNEVVTSVDQSDDTYTVGPFKLDYSKGIYRSPTGRVVKFGWIDDLRLVDQNNNKLNIVDLMDKDGKSIRSRKDYQYPNSEEEFYVKFKYDGSGSAYKVKLQVDFKYLTECQAKMTKWTGSIYRWYWTEDYSGTHTHQTGTDRHESCSTDPITGTEDCDVWYTPVYDDFSAFKYILKKVAEKEAQALMEVEDLGGEYGWGLPIYEEAYLETKDWIDITMSLGGTVFYDNHAGKAGNVNGKYYPSRDGDYGMKNIEVTLYEENGTLVQLAPEGGNNNRTRTNPTLTDSDGYYEFNGLDAQKKYYVVFKFDGQKYENTTCEINKGSYNKSEWEVTSKASITNSDRRAYNERFEHILSSPDNYKDVQNSLTGFGMKANRTFTESQTAEAREALYNEIRSSMSQTSYPNLKSIYRKMASRYGEDLIQFIVDTEITARTGTGSSRQVFPMTDKFSLDIGDFVLGGKRYEAIYDGQYYINLGLMEREKADLNLRKDLIEATVLINNKTYTYKYNARNDESIYLELRGTDIMPYGDMRNFYERDIRESDIRYIDYLNNGPERLRVYLTYRIRMANTSNGEITEYVNSVYDYYDSDYTYVSSYTDPKNKDGTAVAWTQQGNAGTNLKKMITTDARISNNGLKTGAREDVYVQYEVNTDALKRLINEKEATKENYAEIGSYSTYYTYARTYSDGSRINDAGYPAGLIDIDSRPGNFNPTDNKVQNFVAYSYTEAFQKKSGADKTKESIAIFEDDADKAPGLKLKLLTEPRKLNGNVWEDNNIDEKLKNENIRVGDGINNDNAAIKRMKVEIVDADRNNQLVYYYDASQVSASNPSGYVPAVTYTDDNGYYSFNGYAPGNYMVKFTYGEGETLTTTANGKTYNGQDYKSTVYDENAYISWKDGIPNYWYAVENNNRSDAQDDLNVRNTLNISKTRTMTNHLAEVLNYQTTSGQDSKGWLPELQDNTLMSAYTTPLVLEVEYAKQTSTYPTDVVKYEVPHIDFGIIERPRAELTLTKDVENLRIITPSSQTIFDANGETDNLAWIKPKINPAGADVIGRIQATVEQNNIYGSTIKVIYRLTVENTGEKDYINNDGGVNKTFYNTGVPDGKLVTTKIDKILDYVENNFKFPFELEEDKKYNSNWESITRTDLQKNNNSSLVADTIDISSYTQLVISKDNAPLTKELLPANKRGEAGEKTTDTILLTKVMPTSYEDNTDDFVYDNSAEIVKSTNQAGRRSYNVKDKNNYRKDEIADAIVSIPGNFNPISLANLEEPDADVAETIIVLEPMGADKITPIYYVIGGIVIVAVLGLGVWFIKKKVL